MELSQPGSSANTVLPSCASEVAYFYIITIEAGRPIEQDRMLVWACTCLGIWHKYLMLQDFTEFIHVLFNKRYSMINLFTYRPI